MIFWNGIKQHTQRHGKIKKRREQMIDLIKSIDREDVYNGIIPVFLGLIPFLYKVFINSTSSSEWKKSISRSSFDKYISFQIRMVFIMYITVFIMATVCIISIYLLLYNFYIIKNIDRFVKIVFSLSCAGLHIYMICYLEKIKKREEIILFKKKDRKKIGIILFYLPVVINVIILLFSTYKIINIIAFICCVICYIVAGMMLDVEPEYKYVCFYFNNETRLDKVLIKDIKQKGNWIIIKDKSGTQILFKQEDIMKIKYLKYDTGIIISHNNCKWIL